MANLAALIERHRDEIVKHWAAEAQKAASARGLSRPELMNIMPKYLDALGGGGGSDEVRDRLESHLGTRIRQGFDLSEIVEEFVLLERCLLAAARAVPAPERPTEEERQSLSEEIQRTIVQVTGLFHEHMQLDEQREKRYLRLLQTLADSSLRMPDAPLKEKLSGVLEVFIEAAAAHSAALLFYEPGTDRLVTAASAGGAGGEFEQFAASLDLASLGGQIAASDEPTQVADVETTELEVSDSLRHSGIHAILGLRLPPHRKLMGVLYIGLRDRRSFTAREVRRLQALGDRLTLHLDNAKLYADLRDRIAELDAERELRERFVAILAHDLRGPLSVAKLTSEMLVRHPERLDERRDLAIRIERNLERIDRMIRDLLDVSRVRAGQPLPLRLDECDLGAVAAEVAEEVAASHRDGHGDRIRVQAPETVRGVWSHEELRRALWNLVTNAVKHGASGARITIRVDRVPEGARLSVHNLGNPIPPDDQARLFDLYARLETASRSRRGWGLGLALVRASAEAHGGRVEVCSSKEDGTTFSIVLPLDARRFQPQVPAGQPELAPGA